MKFVYVFICLFFPYRTFAQDFLNGSFEVNTATACMFNISNAAYNAVMSNVRGIGVRETLDIFYDADCPGFGMAQEGHYYTTLENPVDVYMPTALSLELSEELVAGKSYTFFYYDRANSIGGGPIELGLSVDAGSIGSLIYTSPYTSETSWTKRTVTFTAPLTGKYITARYKETTSDTYIMIDDFAFDKSASVKETTLSQAVQVYPNPASDEIVIGLSQAYGEALSVRICDQLGRVVRDQVFSGPHIPVSSLPAGLYFLHVYTASGVYTARFVKR